MYTLVELKALEKQFGSPMYLFREKYFVNNYKDFVGLYTIYREVGQGSGRVWRSGE